MKAYEKSYHFLTTSAIKFIISKKMPKKKCGSKFTHSFTKLDRFSATVKIVYNNETVQQPVS